MHSSGDSSKRGMTPRMLELSRQLGDIEFLEAAPDSDESRGGGLRLRERLRVPASSPSRLDGLELVEPAKVDGLYQEDSETSAYLQRRQRPNGRESLDGGHSVGGAGESERRRLVALSRRIHSDWEQVSASMRELRAVVAANGGLPVEGDAGGLRSRLWLAMLEVRSVPVDGYARALGRCPSPSADKINNDAFRTLAGDAEFRAHVTTGSIVRVLNALLSAPGKPLGQRPAALRAGHEHAGGAVPLRDGRGRQLLRVPAVPAARVPAVRAAVAAGRARVRAAGGRVPGVRRPGAVFAPAAARGRGAHLRVPGGDDAERVGGAAAPGRAAVGLSAGVRRAPERRQHRRAAAGHARAAADDAAADGLPARVAAAARRVGDPPHLRDLQRAAGAAAREDQGARARRAGGRDAGVGRAGGRSAAVAQARDAAQPRAAPARADLLGAEAPAHGPAQLRRPGSGPAERATRGRAPAVGRAPPRTPGQRRQAQRRESSPLSAASREPDDEEDEVFFGPLTAAELTGMRRVRSTLHTPTPVLRIQALCRGFLARQEYRRQRDDLRFLAMKGEFSVERRRRWVNVSRPEEPAPLVKRGFRNWFHRSPPMEVKVTIGCETMEAGVARKCLGKLLGTFKGAPPLRRTQSLRRRAPSGRPASGGRMSTGALAVHRPLETPPPVPPLPTFATNPPPPTSSVLVLVPLSDVQPLQDGEKPPTPRKMALFKSGFGSLLSKSPPSKPPVPTYALTPNIRALDSFPTVRSRAVESMNVFVRREEEVASLPCIPRLASAPVVNRVNSECMSVDNARTYNPDTTPSSPIVAPSDSSPPSQPPIVAPPIVSPPPPPPPIVAPPSPIVTPPSPIAAPPMGDSPPAPLSDTDDDSGIAASVTRLAAQPAPNETSHLSPRLSLRLSVDGTSLFSGPAALGLSAFVTPLAPSPEEQEEEEEEEKAESDDDPVSARLRSLRSRRLASTGGDTDGRRFRATQNANRKTAEGKPLAKMGNLQLDRLTKLNTRRNSTYMACRIERFTVIKEGDRPPSPSSAMLARAKERMSMEISDEEDDDVCPLSPLFSSEDEGTVETKRKSTDSVSTALGSEEGNSTLMKKVCRRPVRVQWGSRSVLRDAKMDTPVVEGTPKSILVNKCESPKPAETPTDLCVVRVACIEYPSHVSSEDEEDGEEDEYVPHKSREKGRRKKVV